jgi:putative membrane protein
MDSLLLTNLQNSIIFSLLGIVIFWLVFIIIDKITPYQLWREIIEKNNLALAVIVAAMCIAIAMIISAAIHG